jgi:hypothetical protein
MNIPLDEVFHFDATTRAPGGITSADSTPTWAIYEEGVDTVIQSGSMTERTSLSGRYRGSVTCSTANGFEPGKWYSVQIAATVNTVTDVIEVAKFRCVAAEAATGVATVRLVASGLDDVELPQPSDAADVKSGFAKAMAWLFRRFAASSLSKSDATTANLLVKDATGNTITTQTLNDDGTTQSVGEIG